jgi:hypothetical protein
MRFTILSLGLLAAVGAVRADEKKIDLKDVPPGVLAAVKARFPEGKVTRAAKEEEDHEVIYEIALMDKDAGVDVAVSAKGKILEVERTIDPGKLPAAVAAAIKAGHPGATIKKAEEVVKYESEEDDDDKKGEAKAEDDEGETFFEVVLASPGEGDVEVKVSLAGKILEEDDDEGEAARKDED